VIEGLDKVVIRTAIEAANAIINASPRGDDEDRENLACRA
jgi:hypothetical protein